MDHIILNLDNDIPVTAVVLDIKKSSDTMWHPAFLWEVPKLEFFDEFDQAY